MKKQIDPNLNGLDSDDILLDLSGGKKINKEGELGFASDADIPRMADEPNYRVTDKDDALVTDIDKLVSNFGDNVVHKDVDEIAENLTGDFEIVDRDNSKTQHTHHHRRSSSSSHSSSSHHSSSGSHSSSSHHSSSGSHSSSSHHSSSGSHSSSSHHSSSGSHSSSSHHSSSGSHSSSGHHHSSSKSNKKKMPLAAKICIAILIILLLIVVIVLGTFFFLKSTGKSDLKPQATADVQYEDTIEYNGHTYKYNDNMVAFGFIGVDQEEMETSDQTDFVGAADADIVIAVDGKTGKTSAIAIPRDTMVDIDMYSDSGIFLRTDKAQLCLAYSYGDGGAQSCKNSITSMSRVLKNVPIQKYFALDLSGISVLNDAIGGVTVTSLYNFEDEGIKEGDTVTLKGDMAETYVRRRDMDNVNASLNRTDRQIQYVKAYSKQLAPAVMKDFSVVSQLYNKGKQYSQTNLTLNNMTYIASLLLSKNVTSFDSYTISGTMKESKDPIQENVSHAEFTPDDTNVMETVLKVFYTQVD